MEWYITARRNTILKKKEATETYKDGLNTKKECVKNTKINLLKPTGHYMYHQFNIQQLYALPTLWVKNTKINLLKPTGQYTYHQFNVPSDRTMALGSTQPLTEMSTRNISWG